MERNHHLVEAIKALRTVLQLSKIEHVPARLRLIALHQQLEQPYEAVPHVEALLKHLQIGGPEIADGRITLQLLLTDPESKPARVFDAVAQLTDAIKIYLFDVPARFQAATLDRRLADVLVGLEFVESLKRRDDTSDADLTTVLGRLCAMRGGFSPSVLAQIGNLEEKQKHLPQAVAALKTAFRQFVWLRFSEAGGDYSSVRITELEKRMTKSADKSK